MTPVWSITVALSAEMVRLYRPGKLALFREVRQHSVQALSMQTARPMRFTRMFIDHTPHDGAHRASCVFYVRTSAKEVDPT